MQFLKTVFWVLLAVVMVLFATFNWTPTRVNLWAELVWDTKLPFLMLIAFVLGWLPTWLIMRARVWTFRRRYEALERQHAPSTDATVPAGEEAPTQ